MRIAYFDCFAGISGDMALGALIDAGADPAELVRGLRSLDLPEWELRIVKSDRHGLAATDVQVVVGGRPAGDEPAIRPGHRNRTSRNRRAKGERQRTEGREHDHHAETRTLADIRAVIARCDLPGRVRERGEEVFLLLAEAEARVHNASVDTVHFHEVGAVDSIVDTLGSVFALHLLGVDQVSASDLPTGRGFIQSAHGLMPVPAPATAELLKGVPLRGVDVEGELVTPTGAALLAGLATSFGPMPAMRLEATGYGAGKRTFPFPNLLRVMIGEAASLPEATEAVLLEANIDDMSPQVYEHVMDLALEAGALDAYLQPVQMKKNRPAQILSVLCGPESATALAELLLRETTTLGVRESRLRRRCLERETRMVATPYGDVRVKIGLLNGRPVTVAPEYEDCRALAQAAGVPLKEVQAAALCAARQGMGTEG